MASIEKKVTTRGVRYRVRWRSDGRRVEKWVATMVEAKALKLQAESDALDGVTFDPRPGRQLLNDYFDEWLPARLVKGKPLAASTRHSYAKLWQSYAADTLGRKQLRAVTIQAVRQWHEALVAEKGSGQAAKAYRTLRSVMRTAEADELIRTNPCRVRGGGQDNYEERPLIATKLVLDLADTIEPRYRALVMLAGFASFRTGESLGLRRLDVNILHHEVTVRRQSLENGGQQLFVEHAKSDAGRRTVAIPRVVVDILDAHLTTYVDSPSDALLFTEVDGAPAKRGGLSREWLKALRRVDGPEGLRIHDLRHHAATMAARTPGITLKELMSRIGHSTPVAALRYQHAAQERDRAVATYLDDEIAKARGAGGGLAQSS